ncbi:MAG: FAD-dependent oxidoreductase [Thermomicrobia bacterium]|nr:FAD-dependent oxidoreductase [Thermomicrobia bacterium]
MAHVVIAGGGYAGLTAARTLAQHLPSEHCITLVDRDEHHELTVLLPGVLAGRIPPSRARIPYRRLLPRRVSFIRESIERVDLKLPAVITSRAAHSADFLLVCLGRVPDLHAIPGGTSTRVLKTVEDALAIGTAIGRLRSKATHTRVVLVGAGYTSTEVAGEILGMPDPERNFGEIAVSIVADEPRLLPLGNPRLASLATAMLQRAGVVFHLGADITQVGDGGVKLLGGVVVPYDIAVWGGPSRGGQEAVGDAGPRLHVDPYLRVTGVNRVYAVGDLAEAHDYVLDRAVPASGQFAVQEGRTAAINIAAEIRGTGLHEYRPLELGEALMLGDAGAAAEVAGVLLTGIPARGAKRAALARYLYGLGGIGLVREYL